MNPPVPHNQALRQLVADLAMQPSTHIADVLRGLAPDRRRLVQTLLSETQDQAVATQHMGADLSPWLAERLAARPGLSMTERTTEALRRAAASVGNAPTTPETERPSLLSRLTSRRTAGDAL